MEPILLIADNAHSMLIGAIMLSLNRLKELLDYDPLTGVFVCLIPRRGGYGGRGLDVGDIAGCLHLKGYWVIGIDGTEYKAHRLAWFYIYGVWPAFQIDHLDHDKTNNRIANLRDVTQFLNQQNIILARKKNSSGFLGVHFHKRSGKYVAQIRVSGEGKFLGYFETAKEAHAAYMAEKQIHHSFHG